MKVNDCPAGLSIPCMRVSLCGWPGGGGGGGESHIQKDVMEHNHVRLSYKLKICAACTI